MLVTVLCTAYFSRDKINKNFGPPTLRLGPLTLNVLTPALDFNGNKTHLALETNSTKFVIVGSSNNAEVWGSSPQSPEANGYSGGGAPDAEAISTVFFSIFKHTLV